MSVPVNIDDYSSYLPLDSSELRSQMVPEDTIQRIERLRVRCLLAGGKDILKCFVCRFSIYTVNFVSSKHLCPPF